MSKQAVVSMIVGMILGAGGVWELTARAQVQAPVFRPFRSKNVFVTTKSSDVVATLEAPEIRMIGNRTFVVGPYAKDSKYSREIVSGSPAVWVPLDEVAQFIEIPTPAEKKANVAEEKKEGK